MMDIEEECLSSYTFIDEASLDESSLIQLPLIQSSPIRPTSIQASPIQTSPIQTLPVNRIHPDKSRKTNVCAFLFLNNYKRIFTYLILYYSSYYPMCNIFFCFI
jgi:hypothetical protein